MPRKARRESATGIYHIIIRGINREEIFKQKKDIKKIYGIMKLYLVDEMEIYAYCIMPNHLHMLVKADLEVLSDYMKKVGSVYASYYNLERERTGYVFQGRFKSECVENERYFWTCLRYIHNNPVKAGLAKRGEPYIGCSTWEYQNGKMYLLHKKAFEMCGKDVELYETDDNSYDGIIMDLEEEENEQRNAYLNRKMIQFSSEKKSSVNALIESNTLIKEFITYASLEKVVSRAFIMRKIKEIKEQRK